jgi:copper chaperone NosL
MMAKRSRILILLASLALGLMYVLPVWKIDLEAPQYPEGLGMIIEINTIVGKKPHDLNNINNLNHYIGMQRIEPESIPELKLMPIIVAVLIVTGLLVSLVGRRKLLYVWTAGFIAISLVGMADFWMWEYDYGHNLDEENAIIKIPGMSYQPPLIGSRQILNFTAHSWPGGGGAAAILAAITAVLVSGGEWRRRRSPSDPSSQREAAHGGAPNAPAAAVAALLVLGSGCTDPAPRPLIAGVDDCADCLMVVDGAGHGAELVTTTGKIYTFDSAECMVNHLLTSGSVDPDQVHSTWVVDFSSAEELVPAEEAFYLVSPTLGSPMGLGITAFLREQDRDGAVHSFGGEAADWDAVVSAVARAWPEGRPTRHGGHASTLVPEGPSPSDGPAMREHAATDADRDQVRTAKPGSR